MCFKVEVFAIILALLALASLTTAARNVTEHVCQTPQCLALSAIITSNMNQSADPCDDFHTYACGNFAHNNPYDPATVDWSRDGEPLLMQRGWDVIKDKLNKRVFEMLFAQQSFGREDPELSDMYRLAKGLFRSCSSWVRRHRIIMTMDRTGSNQDISVNFFNGILSHLVDGIKVSSDKNWFERVLAKMVKIGVWPSLQITPIKTTIARERNITAVAVKYIIFWKQPTAIKNFTKFFDRVSLSHRFRFEHSDKFMGIVDEIEKNATYLADRNPGWTNPKYKKWTLCRSRGYSVQYLKLSELDQMTKCAFSDEGNPFSWGVFLDSILDGSSNQNLQLYFNDGSDYDRDYRVFSLLNYLKRMTQSNSNEANFGLHFSFLVTDWLFSFWPYFPEKLAAEFDKSSLKDPFRTFGYAAQSSLETIPLVKSEDPFKNCLELTTTMLGPVLERMFQSYYHEETFDHVWKIIDLVQNATLENVRTQTWISSSSKNAIIDKILSIKKEIGFDVVSVSLLKAFYASTIRTMKQTNFTGSYRNFGTFFYISLCAMAGKRNNFLSVESTGSFFEREDSLTVNAFNILGRNQLIFPMGILSPFLYHKSYPEYMNLGGIGVVIGHEIGHGFDDTGHELNNQGAKGHFWDNYTETGYLQRMQCVRSQFGTNEIVPGKLPANPNATLGNDIADLMGIRSAFAAIKLLRDRDRAVRLPNLPGSLTPEKLLFIQAAQVWCSKFEPRAISEMEGSAHSPAHVRLRGMMANSRDFAAVFKCAGDTKMNLRDKCEFW